MFLRRISRRKFNPQTPMAAVVCRIGTKAQTEISTEKLHIKKKIQHIIGMGRSRGAFCYIFCSSGTSVTWEKVAKRVISLKMSSEI